MRKGFLIYEEKRKFFPIYEETVSHISHIWLCNFSILNFLLYEENLIFLPVYDTNTFHIFHVRLHLPSLLSLEPFTGGGIFLRQPFPSRQRVNYFWKYHLMIKCDLIFLKLRLCFLSLLPPPPPHPILPLLQTRLIEKSAQITQIFHAFLRPTRGITRLFALTTAAGLNYVRAHVKTCTQYR